MIASSVGYILFLLSNFLLSVTRWQKEEKKKQKKKVWSWSMASSIYNYHRQSIKEGERERVLAGALSHRLATAVKRETGSRKEGKGNICSKLDVSLNWDEKGEISAHTS